MYNFKNEFWAFIPARSGSKGLKNKNIKVINGKPLIYYSLAIAMKTKGIKKIIFSSDSLKYISLAKKFGCKDFHYRSKKISNDNASEYSVFKNFIDIQIKENNPLPKYFVHLRPTSPIRKKSTLEKAIRFFKKKRHFTSMRSANLMSNPAYRANRIVAGKLCGIVDMNFNIDDFCKPRHFFQDTYKCGPIFDIYKTENILNGYLWGNKVLPYVIKDIYNDIDTIEDFDLVEYYMKKIKYKI
jgi:N-acylneuraminate cytidylyltransferase